MFGVVRGYIDDVSQHPHSVTLPRERHGTPEFHLRRLRSPSGMRGEQAVSRSPRATRLRCRFKSSFFQCKCADQKLCVCHRDTEKGTQ